MTSLISVEDLAISFNVHGGVVDAVRGVSFRIPTGGSVALVGESGSGKSVISQAIMGLLPPAAVLRNGRILFADPNARGRVVDIAQMPRDAAEMRAIRGGRISIIFQEPMTSLSPIHSIGDQIGEALELHRNVHGAAARELVVDMLRMAGFPDPKRAPRTYPFELSGGLRQRAMIAMALICRPCLLIADEPTTALDVTIQAQILKLIKDLQAELGMALLMITHDLGVVANVADEIVVLYHGKVMESGTLDDIFRHPAHPYLKALLRAVPRFHMQPGERLIPLREIPPPSGQMINALEPWPAGADAAGPLLQAKNLRKRFKVRWPGLGASASYKVAVDDVSFDIKRGESLGLVGESGCGKTTLSKLVMRALSPDSGEIRFNDRGRVIDVLALKDQALMHFRRKIQFIFQDPFGSLNPRMTVLDILSEPLIIHNVGDHRQRKERVKELIQLVGLNVRDLKRYPHSFSGGQRQRIGIARALALKPDLLICDEPVSALDVSIQAQVLNLLKDLQEKLGLTYLFISHNLAVVDYIADRIMVMCAGQIVEIAPCGVLFANPLHPYTKALLTAVPEPNPDYRLAFDKLMEDKASLPDAWPAPFTINETERPGLIDMGEGHFVRAGKALAAA